MDGKRRENWGLWLMTCEYLELKKGERKTERERERERARREGECEKGTTCALIRVKSWKDGSARIEVGREAKGLEKPRS